MSRLPVLSEPASGRDQLCSNRNPRVPLEDGDDRAPLCGLFPADPAKPLDEIVEQVRPKAGSFEPKGPASPEPRPQLQGSQPEAYSCRSRRMPWRFVTAKPGAGGRSIEILQTSPSPFLNSNIVLGAPGAVFSGVVGLLTSHPSS